MSAGDAPTVDQSVCGLHGKQHRLGDAGSLHMFCKLSPRRRIQPWVHLEARLHLRTAHKHKILLMCVMDKGTDASENRQWKMLFWPAMFEDCRTQTTEHETWYCRLSSSLEHYWLGPISIRAQIPIFQIMKGYSLQKRISMSQYVHLFTIYRTWMGSAAFRCVLCWVNQTFKIKEKKINTSLVILLCIMGLKYRHRWYKSCFTCLMHIK